MPISKDEVIQILAKEQGILLNKDDPVLSFLAVHDVVLKSYADEFGQLGERLENKLEDVVRKYDKYSSEVATEIAEETKSRLADAGNDLNEVLRDIVADERQKYRDNLDKLVIESQKATKQATMYMCVSLVCVGLCVASTLLTLF